jgi:carbon monoxide dehydrogenase subunit G
VALIKADVDVARPAEEVFWYVIDPSRFAEWQDGVVSAHIEGDGPQAVGSRCVMTRRIGGSDRTSVSEVTTISPPRTWAVRGLDGPIRADVAVTVAASQDDAHAHVTIEVGFRGYGLGRFILPLVIKQASREVPASCQKLKSRLEAG